LLSEGVSPQKQQELSEMAGLFDYPERSEKASHFLLE
jgi:hypothetical protein